MAQKQKMQAKLMKELDAKQSKLETTDASLAKVTSAYEKLQATSAQTSKSLEDQNKATEIKLATAVKEGKEQVKELTE